MTNLQHLTEDQCLDLVHGLAPSASRKAWLAHLRTCAACEALLRECSDAREHARANAREWLASEPWRARSRATRRFPRAVGFLVAAALIIAVAWLAQTPRPSSFADSMRLLPTHPELTALRGDVSETAGPELGRGIAAYGNRDYALAVRALGQASAKGALEAFRRVYWANALGHSGRYNEARAVLDSVRDESLPEPWKSETQWLRCVIAFDGGDTTAADSLIGVLVEHSADWEQRTKGLRRLAARQTAERKP